MNITAFDIYIYGLLTKLDGPASFVIPLGLFASLMSLAWWWSAFTEGADDLLPKARRRTIAIGCISGLLACVWLAIPSANTFAAMVVIPKIAQSDVIQKDFPALYEAARKALMDAVQAKQSKSND